jgi:hypothetical protein
VTEWSTPAFATERSRRALLLASVAGTALLTYAVSAYPATVPDSVLLIPIVLGAWRLRPSELTVLAGVVLAGVVVNLVLRPTTRSAIEAAVVVIGIGLASWYAAQREQWGFSARRGVQLLLEVRDSLRAQGDVPALGAGWRLDRAMSSALSAALRGDFTLTYQADGWLRLAVVDVSGHGPKASVRAILLGGGFGSLLSELGGAAFLPAANRFVCAQGWREDYATLAQVEADLATGLVHVWSAGHPPVLIRRRGGRWSALPSRGPILGLQADATFVPASTVLRPGDLLLLYTDGMVVDHEDPLTATSQLRAGIETWLEHVARSPHRAPSLAQALSRLPAAPGLDVDDDRAVLVLSRVAGTDPPVPTDDDLGVIDPVDLPEQRVPG